MLCGLRKVRGEWLLADTSHNALNLYRANNGEPVFLA